MGIRLKLLYTLEAIGRNILQSLEHHLYISCKPTEKRLKEALAPFPVASRLVDLNVLLIFVSNQSSRGFHSCPKYSSFGYILTQFPILQIPVGLFFFFFRCFQSKSVVRVCGSVKGWTRGWRGQKGRPWGQEERRGGQTSHSQVFGTGSRTLHVVLPSTALSVPRLVAPSSRGCSSCSSIRWCRGRLGGSRDSLPWRTGSPS